MKKLILDVTPGEILLEEFLEPLAVSQAELSRRTHIPKSRITEIIKGRRSITAETAIALSAFFGNSAEFWMNLQSEYDLRRAQILMESEIRAHVQPLEVA